MPKPDVVKVIKKVVVLFFIYSYMYTVIQILYNYI